MLEALISGLCVAVPSILATVLTNKKGYTLMGYKIEQLEKKVSEHNNLVVRMYEAEKKIALLEDEVKGG